MSAFQKAEELYTAIERVLKADEVQPKVRHAFRQLGEAFREFADSVETRFKALER